MEHGCRLKNGLAPPLTMPISQYDFDQMQARADAGKKRGSGDTGQFQGQPPEAEPCEADLHDKIEDELKRRGWYYVHSRMDMATTTALGVPDFIVAMPQGKTIWLEVKSKTGKMKREQLAAQMMLELHGHRHAVVRSFTDFLNLLRV